MKKEKIITLRLSNNLYNRIDNIRKQLLSTGIYRKETLTNSYIIRESIRVFDNKVKYLMFLDENKKAHFVNNKEDK